MSRIYLYTGLAFSIGIILVLILYLGSGGSFVEGVLPELIGFGLEGLVFVALFSAYEERRNHREMEATRVAARLLLRDAIADIATWLLGSNAKPGDGMSALDTTSAAPLTTLLENLLAEIARSDAITDIAPGSDEHERQFRTFMESELWTLRALLPIVTPLGNDFLKTWLEMIRYLQAAVDAGPTEERRRYYQKAFLPIQGFAKRHYI